MHPGHSNPSAGNYIFVFNAAHSLRKYTHHLISITYARGDHSGVVDSGHHDYTFLKKVSIFFKYVIQFLNPLPRSGVHAAHRNPPLSGTIGQFSVKLTRLHVFRLSELPEETQKYLKDPGSSSRRSNPRSAPHKMIMSYLIREENNFTDISGVFISLSPLGGSSISL